MIVNDLNIDLDNNLIIKNGDFQIGNSTAEHAYALLSINKGDLRFNPALGTDLIFELNNKMNVGLKDRIYKRIKETLLTDGYDGFKLDFEIDQINNKITLKNEAKRIKL